MITSASTCYLQRGQTVLHVLYEARPDIHNQSVEKLSPEQKDLLHYFVEELKVDVNRKDLVRGNIRSLFF